MQKIKNIIFDYGNVIFMLDFPALRQAFVDLGIRDANAFFSHATQNPWVDALDKGQLPAPEFLNVIREAAGKPELTDSEITKAWSTLLVGVPEGYHDLLRDLKQHYRTFLLSNNNEIHYQWIIDYLQREHGLVDNSVFFEQDYYSHLMGMRKPDPAIFQFVLDRHDLQPGETLFIDDSPQHVAAAQQLGIRAELLGEGDTLPELLGRIGVWKK
ncbi:HAD family hydrolase [Parapedobacter lycopersici]|uniref:HAD family hydrolase n=1 Tax=Parapedobacter lycopersici TaxID=1864939 RepID=UPI00214DD584|nr:HAD family phosphatase [Parapedobacter lycopersici]